MNYCALCKINFSSVSSFDAHISISEGFLHKAPEDCGLHETARGWALPPPMRPLTRDEWDGIFHKDCKEVRDQQHQEAEEAAPEL